MAKWQIGMPIEKSLAVTERDSANVWHMVAQQNRLPLSSMSGMGRARLFGNTLRAHTPPLTLVEIIHMTTNMRRLLAQCDGNCGKAVAGGGYITSFARKAIRRAQSSSYFLLNHNMIYGAEIDAAHELCRVVD